MSNPARDAELARILKTNPGKRFASPEGWFGNRPFYEEGPAAAALRGPVAYLLDPEGWVGPPGSVPVTAQPTGPLETRLSPSWELPAYIEDRSQIATRTEYDWDGNARGYNDAGQFVPVPVPPELGARPFTTQPGRITVMPIPLGGATPTVANTDDPYARGWSDVYGYSSPPAPADVSPPAAKWSDVYGYSSPPANTMGVDTIGAAASRTATSAPSSSSAPLVTFGVVVGLVALLWWALKS